MTRLGADPDDLVRVAARFEVGAETLDGCRAAVLAAMRRLGWDGSDARRFLAAWDTVHSPALRVAGERLQQAAKDLRHQADEQRRASGDGGGVGARGPLVPAQPVEGPGVSAADRSGEPGDEVWRWLYDLFESTGKFVFDVGSVTLTGVQWFAQEVIHYGKAAPTWLKVGGRVLGAVGGVSGFIQTGVYGYSWMFSGDSGDLYNAADGYVAGSLSTAGLVLDATGVGAPVGLVLGGISVAWGLGSLASTKLTGRPLSQNVIDFSTVGLGYRLVTGNQLSEDINDVAVNARDAVVDGVREVVEATSDGVDWLVQESRSVVGSGAKVLGALGL